MAADQFTVPKARNHRIIERSATCELCGSFFSWIGKATGLSRRFCSDPCRGERRKQNLRGRPLCIVDGCVNPRCYKSGICNSCYYRRKRTGTVERRVYRHRSVTTHGYVVLIDTNPHPLKKAGRPLYEHRKVLYDCIGPGPHSCHWCGSIINWINGRCVLGSLVPDHLDGNKRNNDPANLVPACNRCNATRGLFMKWVREHRDDPVLWSMYTESLAGKIHGSVAVLYPTVAEAQAHSVAAPATV
jgi:hypothetical protein